ncbi:hypothetical protein BJ875DRAFT_485986 [Amylocarpus encephaloides]|uniref:AT hook domain-containing protein n=1 Tax=Amylocarpus encephaloides TaxID=45428 RepID=A0A9P7YGD6_9HELO|nr:hypothetical protein BJ875DRAFT_485986 [Amylocarpus encephaloides]
MDSNPPFTEQEKRIVLAEALKKSSIPIERLMAILTDGGIQPNWHHMVLPYGRTLASCIDAYESMRSAPQPSPYSSLPPQSTSSKRKSGSELEHLMTAPSSKRRQSGQDNLPSSTRDIRPKPTSANGSPLPFNTLPGPPPPQPKKRGRPSKADVELRQQEAIARGEVLPPPRVITPKVLKQAQPQSQEASRSGFAMIAPMAPAKPTMGSGMGGGPFQSTPLEPEDSPGKKKRARQPPKPKGARISDILGSESDEAQKGSMRAGESSFPPLNPQIGSIQHGHEPQIPPRSTSLKSEPRPILPVRPEAQTEPMAQPVSHPQDIPRGGDTPSEPTAQPVSHPQEEDIPRGGDTPSGPPTDPKS